ARVLPPRRLDREPLLSGPRLQGKADGGALRQRPGDDAELDGRPGAPRAEPPARRRRGRRIARRLRRGPARRGGARMSETASVQAPLRGMDGTDKGRVDLPEIFAERPREHLLYEAVQAQQASRRAGTHATKTRGLVSGGGTKPWRQKGTGRARAGSSRSPLWEGGGTIFGPQPRSYAYRLPASARRVALCAALSDRQRGGTLTVVEEI